MTSSCLLLSEENKEDKNIRDDTEKQIMNQAMSKLIFVVCLIFNGKYIMSIDLG